MVNMDQLLEVVVYGYIQIHKDRLFVQEDKYKRDDEI
jgi:hypothetical protein